MRPNIFITLTTFICLFLITSVSYAYTNLNGESDNKCRYCHNWTNNTTWHDDHKSDAPSCKSCHVDGSTLIPASSCSTSTCHSAQDWEGNPEFHNATESLDCMGCHEDIGSDCPLESALEGDSRIDVLKQFRDQVLTENTAGRMVIDLYYTAAPILTRAVNSSPMVKQFTVSFIDAILPLLEKNLDKK